MNNLSKKQQAVLECALDKLYTFLREKFNVDYYGNNLFQVYGDVVCFTQCLLSERIVWFAKISLKNRKIFLSTREVEREIVYSKYNYSLFYIGSNLTMYDLDF